MRAPKAANEPADTRMMAIVHSALKRAEGYDIVVHTVPPLLRFVLIHGFGPAYRRQAKARWGVAP